MATTRTRRETLLDHLDEREAMHVRHSEAAATALRDAIRAAVLAAIPRGTTDDVVREAFRSSGGRRVAAMAQLVAASDVETLHARHSSERQGTERAELGPPVTLAERLARRASRG